MSRSPRYISKLQGRRVLVLGGTSGIGFAVAEAALEHGAQVIVSSSKQDNVNRALERLRNVPRPLATGFSASKDAPDPPPVRGTTCDVGDSATVETNLQSLLDFATSNRTQLLDHVVFTAGDPLGAATYGQSTAEDLQRRQSVRVIAPSILGKLLPNYVNKAPTSSYTLTSSTVAVKPPPLLTAYTAQTVAVQGLARGLAVELKPVRVNAIEFGLIPTELHDPWPQQMKDAIFGKYRETSLTGSTGDVVDAAEPYLFCMKNAFITGTSIVSDGGMCLV
jgi:NAD(P)-dependent dehydrogenase (short-subunit alcohol dehydrogenase family)